MVKLKPITDNSWLLLTDDETTKVGLLSENGGKITLIAASEKTTFDTRDDVNTFFKEDIFSRQVEREDTQKEYTVKGYPVNVTEPHEPKDYTGLPALPLYSKSANSEVLHCAGHYCVKFPGGWTKRYCPKLVTLQKYEWHGPYKNMSDTKLQFSTLSS